VLLLLLLLLLLFLNPQDLVADEISPGLQLSAMLADILEDATSLHSLSLAGETRRTQHMLQRVLLSRVS
jgi:hypothetical protein